MLLIAIIPLLLSASPVDSFNACDANNLVRTGKEQNETFYVFAITQDCQLIFARADQINQFHGLATDVHQHITYCLPNFVQFHWQNKKPNGNLSLKLVFKRANNQVCILPIDFPRESALSGNGIFRYSLLNSLTYAVCSYMPNSTFNMEPELSFIDSKFVDIVYFVDPKSAGSFWTIRQFKIDQLGYLKALETFVVKNFAEEPDFASRSAGEHLLALDSQKLKLYAAHKSHKEISSTCAYDLLFRPHRAKIQRYVPIRNSVTSYRLNSYSVDYNTALFVESERNRNSNGFKSRVFVSDRRFNYSAKCLMELPYAVKFEIISKNSLIKLRDKQLPKFNSDEIRSRLTTTEIIRTRPTTTTEFIRTRPTTTTELSTEPIELTTIEVHVEENELDNLTEEGMGSIDNENDAENQSEYDVEVTNKNERLQKENNTEESTDGSNSLLTCNSAILSLFSLVFLKAF